MTYNNANMPISLTSYKKLALEGESIAIKLYPVSKDIKSINNSTQSLTNNRELTSEKNITPAKPYINFFLHSYVNELLVTKKNVNNPLQQKNLVDSKGVDNKLYYAVSNIVKFTNQNDAVKVKPTYAEPHDSVERQQDASNDIYYDAEGYSIVEQEKHIYEKISDYALEKGEQMDNEIYYDAVGKNEEHIYETISDFASDKISSHLNSNKEINVENDLTPLERSVVTTMERNEITRLAEQTFAPAKSFISRFASTIWDTLFGSKNESKIVPPAELAARAMRTNINAICDRFNEYIAKKTISGAFRQQPSSEYNLTDNKKLVHTFNKDSDQHDHIELSFLIKAYIGRNFSKIELEELNNTGFSSNKFDEFLDKKLTDCMLEDPAKQHLPTVLATIANTLRLATGENKIDGLTTESLVTSMLPQLIDDECAFELAKDRAEKKLSKSSELDKMSQFNILITNYFSSKYK